jgi:putative PEP-CTERM system TPR-repeat lipoprotein
VAGEFADAIKLLEQVPYGAGPDFSREQLLLFALADSGQNERAVELLDRLEQDSANQPTALRVIADFHTRTGKLTEAKAFYRQALALDDELVEAWLGLGRAEYAGGNVAEARSALRNVIEIDPGHVQATLGVAEIERDAGNLSAAINLLSDAKTRIANNARLGLALAQAYLVAGNSKEALGAARDAFAIENTVAEIQQGLGRVFMNTGALEEAVAAFKVAAGLAPGSAAIQLDLGYAYLSIERIELASRVLQRALDLEQDLLPAAIGLALIDVKRNDLDLALNKVQEMRENYPDEPSVMVLEGEVRSQRGEFAAAMSAFGRAADKDAGSRAAYLEYSAASAAGVESPESALIRWLQRHPDDHGSRLTLANHFSMSGRSADAVREYEVLLDAGEEDPIVLNNLAWEYQGIGELDRAIELATEALEADPELGSAYDTLGWALFKRGDLERSFENLRRSAEMMPRNGNARFRYASVLAQYGRDQEAIGILQELLDGESQFSEYESAEKLLDQLKAE